jgi:hypothetical protein
MKPELTTLFRVYLFLLTALPAVVMSQDDSDLFFIKKIHAEALSSDSSYFLLKELCTRYPGRLAGSPAYLGAAGYMENHLSGLPHVSAYQQECIAQYWERGSREEVYFTDNEGNRLDVRALSLGNSVSTVPEGVYAEVVEFQSLDEVEALNPGALEGKVAFFNRPMAKDVIHTFHAYGRAVDQRSSGASVAATKGAVAVLVRSVTHLIHSLPHTGGVNYRDSSLMIPAVAISTVDADILSQKLSQSSVHVFMKTDCRMAGPRSAPNVIGEMKGSEFPEKIIVVGGHLDSWDGGQGAHDDGSGCVQSAEVLRIFNALNYKPRHTIRCVLFSNEENGVAGGRTYADNAERNAEQHVAALESDAGGFSPRGFSFDASPELFNDYYRKVSEWLPLLEPYGYQFEKGYSGVYIGPLKPQGPLLIGLRPDSQRYFDFHHNENDRVENVHPRELALGAAAMASLIYLIDKYGLN